MGVASSHQGDNSPTGWLAIPPHDTVIGPTPLLRHPIPKFTHPSLLVTMIGLLRYDQVRMRIKPHVWRYPPNGKKVTLARKSRLQKGHNAKNPLVGVSSQQNSPFTDSWKIWELKGIFCGSFSGGVGAVVKISASQSWGPRFDSRPGRGLNIWVTFFLAKVHSAFHPPGVGKMSTSIHGPIWSGCQRRLYMLPVRWG